MKQTWQQTEPKTNELKKVSDLFAKYKKILTPPEGPVLDAFCELVYDLCGCQVDKKQISYNVFTRTIHTRLPGPLKNEIFLKKDDLINQLKIQLGAKGSPKNIL